MTREEFALFWGFMEENALESAHDRLHVERVLYGALEIARTEEGVDRDVLVCACVLHDIGRREQAADPKVCHAVAGAEKAQRFLLAHGYDPAFAQRVAGCIQTHRFRSGPPPQSLEARILYDADKLDATGLVGQARTLFYAGQMAQPLYSLRADGSISPGAEEEPPSFFREYAYKLCKLYHGFYTQRGQELALARRPGGGGVPRRAAGRAGGALPHGPGPAGGALGEIERAHGDATRGGRL